MLLLLAIGCASPISNEVLLADGAFLAALPSDGRLAAPAALQDLRTGDSVTLRDAQDAAATLDLLTAGARASTAALIAATPDERSEVLRAWDATSAAAELDGGTRLWWITAQIYRADADADLEWTVSAAGDPDGDFVVIGEGQHDPAGSGTFSWDARALADLLGADAPADDLAVLYDDAGAADGGRDVTVTGSTGGIPSATWELAGTAALAWTGTFAVTDDGAAWPGSAVAVALAGAGGRATGEVTREAETLAWDSCWDAAGDEVYRGGDPGVPAIGAPGACAVGPLD